MSYLFIDKKQILYKKTNLLLFSNKIIIIIIYNKSLNRKIYNIYHYYKHFCDYSILYKIHHLIIIVNIHVYSILFTILITY